MAGSEGKKSRKAGRNANRCKAYKLSNTRERNKMKRLAKHLLRFPGDMVAVEARKLTQITVRGY